MIFLSYSHVDSSIVDPIAQELYKVYGADQIFFDKWSILPGDGIIDRMNSGLDKCNFFFCFFSKDSLKSNMVSLEWQNALYISANRDMKIIPVRLNNCAMPSLLKQKLYIDTHSNGYEVTLKQMIDVINGNNTYLAGMNSIPFHNVSTYIIKNESNVMVLEFRAEVYMEPHSRFLVLVDNKEEDLNYCALNESLYESKFYKQVSLNDKTSSAILLARQTAISPGFPFIAQITAKEGKKIQFIDAMRATSATEFSQVPVRKAKPQPFSP